MPDLKIVLYKDNHAPRSVALSTGLIYRTLFLASLLAILLVAAVAMAARFYFLSRAGNSQATRASETRVDESPGTSGSAEDQNRALRDQVDQLKARLANAQATQNLPREIDKRNPALALFSPIVADKTQDQSHVVIRNIRHTRGADPARPGSVLSFELSNAHPGESVEKGYIVVLARNDNGLHAYPNVFKKNGPYLLDFESGETFQVARFRMVNAEFDAMAQNFQILIFTPAGELLINTLYEVTDGAN